MTCTLKNKSKDLVIKYKSIEYKSNKISFDFIFIVSVYCQLSSLFQRNIWRMNIIRIISKRKKERKKYTNTILVSIKA